MRLPVPRWAALLGGIAGVTLVAVFLLVVGFALLSPYSSARVPESCTGAGTRLPADRSARVPGAGTGTLLAQGGTASVVVVSSATDPSGGTAYIIDRPGDRIVQRVHLAGHAVVAAVSDGLVFLFDDKIGYVFRASSGERVPRLIESDNYRGLYASGGAQYLQTDAEIAALGFDGHLFFHRTVDFAGIAYGCFIPSPAG